MTDRRAIALVARREISERVRSRAFRIGTLIMVLLVVGVVIGTALLGGGTTTYQVGTVGSGNATVLQTAHRQQAAFDAKLAVRAYASDAAARKAVADKDVDAVLADGKRLLARSNAPDKLVALLQSAAQGGAPPLAVVEVGTDKASAGVAFAGTLLLYVALLTFGYVLAGSIVEEKSSRVIELLLAAIRPLQLLAGKVIGVGLVGLAQVLSVAVAGIVAGVATGTLDLPSSTVGGTILVAVYFVLGYALYAMAFAATASLVSRQEDIQSVTAPITVVLIAVYLLSIGVSDDPNSTVAVVGTYLPPMAPMVVPSRALQGELGAGELIASLALMVAATVLLLLLAARIYRHAVMQTGAPIKLRQALRLGR